MRQHGFGALALFGDAGMDSDGALRVEFDGGAILRRDLGAADAVERRRRIGHLDETGEADAAIDAFLAQCLLLGAQAGVIDHRVEMRESLVMRELFKLEARRGLRRIAVIGKQIAAADFQRVHADFRRGEFDQTFGDRDGDRMTDGAVLAHEVFVLEHDARLGAVVRTVVRAAGQINDLISLDARRARVNRVGTDAGEIVDLEGGDDTVFGDADLALDAVIAGVNVGDETLDAVGDELDWAFEQLRQRDRRHLIGISVHLDAERAADILGQHAHLRLRQIEMPGEQVLHHVRRLRRMIDGQALFAFVPVGDDGAALGADAGVAAGDEGGFDHRVRVGKRLVDLADIELSLEAQIVAQTGVDHRRGGIERRFRIGDGGQFLIDNVDQFAGVLGLRARARDHGADRFALPAGAVDRDGRLRR